MHVVSSPCLIYMYIYLQGKGDMIPAALPVVPISLSLLARYVREKRRKKGKQKPKKATAFYYSFQIIHSEQHLSSAYACLCVYVSQTWQVRGSLVVHVHSIKKCIFVVVVHGSLFVVVCCTLPEAKSNGHHLLAGRCQLCCEAENPNSPSPKRGQKKEKKKRNPPIPMLCSHLLETNINEIPFC